jgi:epoxyqueuosine reductase QueG
MQRLILPSSPTRSKPWGNELGFQDISIADAGTEMKQAESDLQDWLSKGCHGEMDYMAKHGTRRTRPAELVPLALVAPSAGSGMSNGCVTWRWGWVTPRFPLA